jgi:membrane protein implicated in regulation of membrane protease activity
LGDLETIFWAVLPPWPLSGSFSLYLFSCSSLPLGLPSRSWPRYLGAGTVVQVAGFVVASLLSLVILRPILLRKESLQGGERYVSKAGVTGKSGVVTNAIEPGVDGMVRIGTVSSGLPGRCTRTRR